MPKLVDHDRQREQLLDACFRLFTEQGYAAATMRRVAEAAGVSTGTLYHYFPDKRAMLSGLFDLWTQRDTERLLTTLPARATVPVRLRTLFRFFADNVEHFRALLRLVLEVHRHEPERRDELRAAVAQYRQAVGEVLGVSGAAEHLVFSYLLGVLVQGLVDPAAEDLAAQEDLVQAAWAHLAPLVADGVLPG